MSSNVTMMTMATTNCNEKDHDLSSPPSPDEATAASSNSGSSESKNDTNSNNNSSSSSLLFDRYTSNIPWVVDSLQGCEENLMTVLDDNKQQQQINISRISESDLSISNLLGQGGFCNVLRVYYDDENDVTGEFISKEYAMKCLNPNKFFLSSSPSSEENDDGEKQQEEDEDEEDAKAEAFVLAASDLAMEVCILSMLNHNNIISLTGITNEGFCQSFRSSSSVGNDNNYGFFFLMNVLKPQSLFDLLTKWRKYNKNKKGLVRKLRRTLSNRSCSQQGPSRGGESTRRQQQQQQQSTMNRQYVSPIEAMRILAGSNAVCGASSHSSRRPRRLSPSGGSSIASNDDVQSQLSQSCRSTYSHTSQQSQLSQSYRSTASSISSCDTSSQFDDKNDRMFISDKPPCLKDRFELIVKGVINGLTYLHSQGIVFRDLKPSNIGFDARDGQVKLFDFGLARRTCDCKSNEIAGSYRYMSPEMIAKANNDDNEDVSSSTTTTTTTTKDDLLKAMDVYSLSVLLWEVATLQRPYSLFLDAGGRPSDSFMKTVVQEGWRHSLRDIIYEPLGSLIQESWNPVPSTRPTMAQIQAIIELPDFHIPNKDDERRHLRRGGGGRGIINYRGGVTARRRRSSEDGATTTMGNNCSNDREFHPPAGGFSQYKPSRRRFWRSRYDGDDAEILNCSTHSSPAFIMTTESKFHESAQNIVHISSSDTRTAMPPKSELTLTDDVEEDGGGGSDQEYKVPLKG